MNPQTILAVTGVLATTIFGAWAIAAAFRFSRNVRITYALDQMIALTDDIAQNFADLAVIFRGEPVSANLVLLKGYLINTGRRDIAREMIEDQISIHVPPEFEWVDSKVVETSPSLHAEARLMSAQEIEFTTGLWKKKEYMKFEALAKVPVVEAGPDNPPDERPTVRLRKAISFTHRISDSDRIEETRVPRPSRIASTPFPLALMGLTKLKLIIAAVSIAFGIAFLVAGQSGFMSFKQLGYSLSVDGTERVVTPTVKKDAVLLSGDDGFSHESSLAEFEELFGKKPVVVTKKVVSSLFMGITYCVFGFLILAMHGIRALRNKRMLTMIAKTDGP